jgi:hypothetical protein
MPVPTSRLIDAVSSLLLCVALGITACGDDGGGAGSGGTGTGGTTTGATISSSSSSGDAYVPDDEPCEPQEGCVVDEDCCPPTQPVSAALAPSCPGPFPYNWTCDDSETAGVCVHGGCSSNQDCVIDGLTCETIDGEDRCVEVCEDDVDCTATANMPGTKCIGTTVKYCAEDIQ